MGQLTWFGFDVSDALPPLGIFSASRRRLRHPAPRHQFIDALLRPAVHEACQQVGEIDLRIDKSEVIRPDLLVLVGLRKSNSVLELFPGHLCFDPTWLIWRHKTYWVK